MLGDDTRSALDGAPCAVAIALAGYAVAAATIAKIGDARDRVASIADVDPHAAYGQSAEELARWSRRAAS